MISDLKYTHVWRHHWTTTLSLRAVHVLCKTIFCCKFSLLLVQFLNDNRTLTQTEDGKNSEDKDNIVYRSSLDNTAINGIILWMEMANDKSISELSALPEQPYTSHMTIKYRSVVIRHLLWKLVFISYILDLFGRIGISLNH